MPAEVRKRRTSEFVNQADRIRLLEAANGKLVEKVKALEAQVELTDRLLSQSSAILGVESAFSAHLRELLVSWVTSKRAGNRWLTADEKALYDEGAKLVHKDVGSGG